MRRFLKACLLRNERGSVIVEFALAIPLLAGVALSVTEVGSYLLLHTKLQHVSVAIADLATRDKEISEQIVNDLFAAAPMIVAPFELGPRGVIVITAIGRDGNDAPRVMWQRRGAGTLDEPSRFGPPGHPSPHPGGITVDRDETVVVAEVTYDYRPLALELFASERITKISYFRPRLGSLQQVDP